MGSPSSLRALDFVGVDAPSQQVTVTTEGEGLTWTAEPEEAIAEWDDARLLKGTG